METINVKNHGLATLYANLGLVVLNIVTGLLKFSTMPDCNAYDMVFDHVVRPLPSKDNMGSFLLGIKRNELSRLLQFLFSVLTLSACDMDDFEFDDNASNICIYRTANHVLIYRENNVQYRYYVDWAGDMETTLRPMMDTIVKDLKNIPNTI